MKKAARKCPYCGYVWETRVSKPKRCPYCLKWLPEWKAVARE